MPEGSPRDDVNSPSCLCSVELSEPHRDISGQTDLQTQNNVADHQSTGLLKQTSLIILT